MKTSKIYMTQLEESILELCFDSWDYSIMNEGTMRTIKHSEDIEGGWAVYESGDSTFPIFESNDRQAIIDKFNEMPDYD